jgi:putative hydrolase of the HAD superfamily
MKPTEITDIIFDLGNVLVTVDWTPAYRKLAPHLPPDRARLMREDEAGFQELFREPAAALETGRVDFAEFYSRMTSILDVQIPEKDFREIWCNVFSMKKDMVALGEQLSEHYQTWLASNTSRAHYRWIMESFPRVSFYREAALSFELGVMKPAVEYYDKALRLFGIEASRSVFIDDLSENVAGAVSAGINGVVFRGRSELLRELHEMGVRVPNPAEEVR